ncbi:hypothetical protein RvY_04087, partial [Ramazzottius varieornatus]
MWRSADCNHPQKVFLPRLERRRQISHGASHIVVGRGRSISAGQHECRHLIDILRAHKIRRNPQLDDKNQATCELHGWTQWLTDTNAAGRLKAGNFNCWFP